MLNKKIQIVDYKKERKNILQKKKRKLTNGLKI